MKLFSKNVDPKDVLSVIVGLGGAALGVAKFFDDKNKKVKEENELINKVTEGVMERLSEHKN